MIANIIGIANLIINIYMFCILAYVILSWIPSLQKNVIAKFVITIVQPYLKLFRFIPPIGMIDISPIIAIWAYNYLSQFLLLGLEQVLKMFV